MGGRGEEGGSGVGVKGKGRRGRRKGEGGGGKMEGMVHERSGGKMRDGEDMRGKGGWEG